MEAVTITNSQWIIRLKIEPLRTSTRFFRPLSVEAVLKKCAPGMSGASGTTPKLAGPLKLPLKRPRGRPRKDTCVDCYRQEDLEAWRRHIQERHQTKTQVRPLLSVCFFLKDHCFVCRMTPLWSWYWSLSFFSATYASRSLTSWEVPFDLTQQSFRALNLALFIASGTTDVQCSKVLGHPKEQLMQTWMGVFVKNTFFNADRSLVVKKATKRN